MHSDRPTPAASAPATAPGQHRCFTSAASNSTYCVNTTLAIYPEAQAACAASGGYLVAYSSLQEQREVEAELVASGVLLGNFHQLYWMGLRTGERRLPCAISRCNCCRGQGQPSSDNSCIAPTRPNPPPLEPAGLQGAVWPNFTWADRSGAVYKGNYQRWGALRLAPSGNPTAGQVLLEPNNLSPPEHCAGSNITDAALREGVGTWADQSCFRPFASICEIEPLRPYPSYISYAGLNFTFYGGALPQAAAQAACYEQGGHLAAFTRYEQQQDDWVKNDARAF